MIMIDFPAIRKRENKNMTSIADENVQGNSPYRTPAEVKIDKEVQNMQDNEYWLRFWKLAGTVVISAIVILCISYHLANHYDRQFQLEIRRLDGQENVRLTAQARAAEEMFKAMHK